ncbi:MAG: ABC transporter ATP-binding protein [Gemmatimonadaceae bacterium]|jgi:ABC-2 type transport system ATP-binding protein|nr:ABC transporter ATP-binding protein [Gemmatimonadaceae bacterium]
MTALPLPASSPPLALDVIGLKKSYGDVVAVNGLDLRVHAGQCFGLLGPNGAGKTTTIEICEGLNTPDSGTVRVLGHTWNEHPTALREKLGVQLQETQLAEKLTVLETLKLFRSFYRAGRNIDDVIDLVQLGEKKSARVGGLSGGQKQRLALACALVGDPELLFLDEPTTGLDPQSRRQLWTLVEGLKAEGRTIVLTTHYMDEAERLCDNIAIVDQGRVISLGTPRQLIASLGAEHVIRLNTADEHQLHPIPLAELLALDDVRGGAETETGYELRVGSVQKVLPSLLSLAESRQVTWSELSTHSATLEDVFVALTGRHLREG